MQKLKMIPCPKCERPFPEKRKELGFHVCVNCSTTDKVVGITTVEGTGDHTWNDLIIMDRRTALQIAAKEAEITGRKVELDLEVQDYEKDEEAISQSMNEAITKSLSESEQDTNYDIFDPNKQFEGVKGIDY